MTFVNKTIRILVEVYYNQIKEFASKGEDPMVKYERIDDRLDQKIQETERTIAKLKDDLEQLRTIREEFNRNHKQKIDNIKDYYNFYYDID